MSQVTREELKVAAERAVLVHVRLPDSYDEEGDPFRELRALTATAGAEVVGELIQKRRKPRGRTYLGKGKVEELAQLAKATGATLVIFDNDLSPAQVRSLEEVVERKIIDRSELILDIFANRATTHAAKLQVEIAQLEYTFPRLRAMWDHLGQVVGGAPVGIGTRGPGEQQLEIDRRIVQRRLSQLKRELNEIQARRTRAVEQRNLDHFTVGLVGYTNAGKSTLFNRLTEGGAFAHGKLFATLGTRIERWELGGGNAAMLSDTVGFIRDLPHHLVASFRSTLEETIFAQLLILVVDISDPAAAMQLETVEATLDEIGASDQPRLLVFNKVDQLADSNDLLVWLNRHPDGLPISAARGEGLEELTEAVRTHALGPIREVTFAVPLREGETVDYLEKRASVLERDYDATTVKLRVRIGQRQVDQLLTRGGRFTIDGRPPREAMAELWPPAATPPPRRVPLHERFHS
ncbi:MAG: GTPase HflX [Phycisphaerales bacterium]|nr:GTPase HflX [Phycisphaerales bacterium]